MAASSIKPNQVFPNIVVNAAGFTIPFADLPSLTQASIDPNNGNVAELLRNIIEKCLSVYEKIPVADRPSHFTIGSNSTIYGGIQKDTYSVVIGVRAPVTSFAAINE